MKKAKSGNVSLQDCEEVLSKCEKDSHYYLQAKQSKARTLISLGKAEKANELLIEMWDSKNNDSEYLDALARSYQDLNDYINAEKCYLKAFEICKDISFKKYLKIKLEFIKNIRNKTEINPFCNSILSLPSNRLDLIEKVKGNDEMRKTLCEQYCEHYRIEVKKRAKWYSEDYIMCLKGWSSSTPVLSLGLRDHRNNHGGGFYVHYKGIGIVIDPGINFIENLHNANLFIQDIHAVIVTHDHIDHNNDLRKIFDLSYQTKHDVSFFLDKLTYLRYSNEIEEIEKRKENLVKKIYSDTQNKEIMVKIKGVKLALLVNPTEHGCEGSFCLKLRLKDKLLGYTSDTKYNPDIGDFFQEVDVLIANISSTDEKDMLLERQKSNHLGIAGAYQLLNNLNKKNATCLLTEFWGGLGDIRLEIVKLLYEYLPESALDIVPMDIGMVYYLDSGKYLCNSCGAKVNRHIRKIGRLEGDFPRMLCFCENCLY